jgi:hypothetical protein
MCVESHTALPIQSHYVLRNARGMFRSQLDGQSHCHHLVFSRPPLKSKETLKIVLWSLCVLAPAVSGGLPDGVTPSRWAPW